LDRVSTKFYTLSLCIAGGFVAFSLAITISYQEVTSFVEDMVKASSFGVLWVFYGFVGADWGALPLSLDLGGIKTCFGEIHDLESQEWNLYLLLYTQYQNKKYLI